MSDYCIERHAALMNLKEALLGKLASVFVKVERQMCAWDESHARSDEFVQSLCNLLEQLHACESTTAFTCKALAEFEDLKPRLCHKLIKSIELVMKELSQETANFEAVSKRLSKYKALCFEEYQKHTDTLSLESVVEGCPDCPSIAHLLEWITDLDMLYHQLYEQKRSILDRVSYDSSMKVQTTDALKEWKSNPTKWPRFKGIREQITVLIAQKKPPVT